MEFARDLDVIADISEKFRDEYYASLKQTQTNEKQVQYRTDLLFLEMTVNDDHMPSPLRKGNFDLLLLQIYIFLVFSLCKYMPS